MVVERVDSRFRTAIRTRDPRRFLLGERTWSPLEAGERVILERAAPTLNNPSSYSQVVIRDELTDDTIRYRKREWYGFGTLEDQGYSSPNDRDEVVVGETINEPNQPWAGKLRFKKLQETAA